MTSTEIALLLNSNSEKITRIGEIIGKKIEQKDNFENLNEFEKTFILIDVLEHNVTNGGVQTILSPLHCSQLQVPPSL